jgi:hypothetical protein
LGAGFSKSFCPDIPLISDLTDLLFIEKMEEKHKEVSNIDAKEYIAKNYQKA